MELRNKKTGEIIGYDEEVIYYRKLTPNGHEDWTPCQPEDWEDYPPAEPLIKDPKIRKAVRAWAEVDEIEAVEIVSKYQLISLDEHCSIEFFKEIYPDYVHNEEHTITELCGEDEE